MGSSWNDATAEPGQEPTIGVLGRVLVPWELPSDEPVAALQLAPRVLRGNLPGIFPAVRCPRIAITNSFSGCGAPGSGRETSARVARGLHAFASSPAVADVATERDPDVAEPLPRESLANRPALPGLFA